ncbi:hypothetical protein ABZ814_26785 [Micromonospora musae]|uniref:MmyB family transcriptional regulator n=1 Tax=Micromonospora musae TaxID=1894970 RepID=UPI003410ED21
MSDDDPPPRPTGVTRRSSEPAGWWRPSAPRRVWYQAPSSDVVHANPAASFLFADFADFAAMPPPHRNGLRWMLLAEEARALYGDAWEDAAEEMVGMFRLDAGRHPHDGRLAEIVADLSERSAFFRRSSAGHAVSSWKHDRKVLSHPVLGTMGFTNEFITVHSAPSLHLVTIIPDEPERIAGALRRSSEDQAAAGSGTPNSFGGSAY